MFAAAVLLPEPPPTPDRLAAALDVFTHLASGLSIVDAYTVHGPEKLRRLMADDARHWLSTLEKSDSGVRHPKRARSALARFEALLTTIRWDDTAALGQLRTLAREFLVALGVVEE